MIALETHQLNVALGGVQVLQSISLQLPQAAWTAVVGPNGAGKSTLLKALAGLIAHTGKISLFNRNLYDIPLKRRAQTLAWLGQKNPISDHGVSVYDTVMLGRLPHQSWLSAPTPADHAAVEQAMRHTQSTDWRHRSLASLSGGEQQRVFLARLLAVQAAVVLMDEPLASLDAPHQVDWVQLVKHLVASGVTVISVLHELSVALAADQMVVMDQGRVIHSGACDQTQTHRALETAFSNQVSVRSEADRFSAHLNLKPF